MKILISGTADLNRSASEFLTSIGNFKHFALYGPMGVGKTTFIKAVCQLLGVVEVVTSPTFALINEYSFLPDGKVYHFDFYRINKLEELYDFGYEDYLYSTHYCFIEWPEKGEDIIPDHFLKIYMKEMPDGARSLEFNSGLSY